MGTRTEGSRSRRAEREKGGKGKEEWCIYVWCVVCVCVCVFRVSGFRFRVKVLGFRVWGSKFKV